MVTMSQQSELESLMDRVAALIEKACANGDNVKSIAERAGLSRPEVSRIKNKTSLSKPGVATLSAIAGALGYKIDIVLRKSPTSKN